MRRFIVSALIALIGIIVVGLNVDVIAQISEGPSYPNRKRPATETLDFPNTATTESLLFKRFIGKVNMI